VTITTKQARELRKRITKLVKAEVESSWKGGKMPEDWPEIEERLRIARKHVHEHIERLKMDDGRIKP
jgi:hypothetical protein